MTGKVSVGDNDPHAGCTERCGLWCSRPASRVEFKILPVTREQIETALRAAAPRLAAFSRLQRRRAAAPEICGCLVPGTDYETFCGKPVGHIGGCELGVR